MTKKMRDFVIEHGTNVKRKTLKQMIPNAPDDAIDLLSKLFTYDPEERYTAN